MYKLSSSDSMRTVFVSDFSLRFFQWIFGMVGIALLPIGLVVILVEPSGTGAYLAGVGLIFTAAAFLIGDNNRQMPVRLEFRNDEGRLTAVDKNNRVISIPFCDIQGFYAFDKRQRTGCWISTVLKSGEFWDLLYLGGPGRGRKRDELMTLLQTNVQLNAPLTLAPSEPVLPLWVQKQKKEYGVTYTWRNPASLRDSLVLGSLFGGFVLLIAGGLADFLKRSAEPFFASAFAVVVLFTIGLHIYRQQHRSHILSIGGSQVVYGHPRATAGVIEEAIFAMDRNKLKMSYYSLDLAGSQRYSILFVDAESRRTLDSLRIGGIGLADIFSFVQKYSYLFTISFIARPVLDIVALKQDIQAELNKK